MVAVYLRMVLITGDTYEINGQSVQARGAAKQVMQARAEILRTLQKEKDKEASK